MRLEELPEHIQDLAAANPDVKIQLSITVDPLVLNELRNEQSYLPMVRMMDSDFLSEAEAQRYLAGLLFGSSKHKSAAMPADEAKRLVVDAIAATGKSEKLAKANQALRLSPDCAEAYIVLAGLETESRRRIELVEQGMEIASTQIDKSRFEDPDGYFWHKLSTRPYMRCRTALAVALWETGEKQTAIDHFMALLKLNPSDGQGLRFHLLNWMLDFNPDDPGVDEYCDYYEMDRSAFIKYACALWKYARHGDSKTSQKGLSKAVEANKFVPALLCRRTEIPKLTLTRVVRGTPEEAIAYHRMGADAWRKVDGALEWLADNCATLLTSKTLLRKIQSAQEFKYDGTWVAPVPMELSL